ncbi:DUF72 domain-containing protein [Mucilaginibacter sp. CAU 1740]|uniref:DUF72 domain-containing protein n=1 Tax=Mucilaginibacter sp. CAU 1740 TaxID=3140365 RepID=UPI00325AD835
MELGHVQDLSEIDFSLAPDSASTLSALQRQQTTAPLQVYIGAPKWGEKSWKGIIYPKKANDKELLIRYSQNFNTVEFGPTFYNIYNAAQISNWATQISNPDFKFCPKFPQLITHISRLGNARENTDKFYHSLKGFGDHLGPLLLQLGENFSPKSFTNLKNYLEGLDPAIKVHVEIRNKNWFVDQEARKDFFELLKSLHVGTVISDTAGRRDCVHMELTTPNAMIRFVGNNLHESDYRRMDDWVARITTWQQLGLQKLWFFMHQNDERYVPQACAYFIEQLTLNPAYRLARLNS